MATCVTIGKFDGYHKGHMLLLEECKRIASEMKLDLYVCKIDLDSDGLLTKAEEDEFLKDFGVDKLIRWKFTKDFMSLSPEEFFQQKLIDELGVKAIVVGNDFRFGKNRAGDINRMARLSEVNGIVFEPMEKLELEGAVVSSTRIREALSEGQVDLVAELMGRPYYFSGIVAKGKQIGTTLGFPTVNLSAEGKHVPKNGVYASRVTIERKGAGTEQYDSITNVGKNPTVSEGNPVTVETFIYDFNQDIYGDQVKVELLKFIREEKKFASLEELENQIAKDIEVARK